MNPKSSASSPTPASPCSPLTLTVQGLGNIPSFKNSKQLFSRNGRPCMATKSEYAKLMQRLTRAFASQLTSYFQTIAAETSTEPSQPCSTALWPLDDSRQWIAELRVTSSQVPSGQEGVVLKIERID